MTRPGRVSAVAAGLLLATLAPAAPGAAQIYKWVDDKGTVHFSNDPPPKVAVEELPETEHRPLVKNGPPGPGATEDEPADDEAAPASPRRAAVRPAPDDEEATEEVAADPDVIVVDGGQSDLVTRYRANSPRNRPGQPIRQPGSGGGGGRPPRRVR